MTPWRVIYNQLLARIREIEIDEEGEKPKMFDTEAQLCKEFSASRETVRTALRRLENEGYLEAIQGRGRIVRKPFTVTMKKVSLNETSSSFSKHIVGSSEDEEHSQKSALPSSLGELKNYSQRLDPYAILKIFQSLSGASFDNELVLYVIQRVRSHQSIPIALQTAIIPRSLMGDRPILTKDLVPGALTKAYESQGIFRKRIEAEYSPAIASQDERRLLNIGRNAPILIEWRTSYCELNGKELPYERLLTVYTARTILSFNHSQG